MEQVEQYIQSVLGFTVKLKDIPKQRLDKLPLYMRRGFAFKQAEFLGRELVFLEAPIDRPVIVQQLEKQLQNIAGILNKTLVLLVQEITTIARKKLIEKGINFIVPGRQMYLPSLLLDLNEVFVKSVPQKDTLLPSAQALLIYRILNRNEKIEDFPFNALAEKLGYTPMAITKAVDNLKQHGLCTVTGTKEKYVHFPMSIPDLWNTALPLFTTPVLKQVFVDGIKGNVPLAHSNASALPEYSEMTEGHQSYCAVDKNVFYYLQKRAQLLTPNEVEGELCLEVWKYDPKILTPNNGEYVDPISLYLSLRQNDDERIQQALEKITVDYIW